jgi:hypothetical protein
MGLESREGCPNYMHMLGSGHVADMLFHHWCNLYMFSNQDWEALNMLVKQVYFRRTARGGGRQASRLLPIARWLQRRLVFMAVEDEADLTVKLEAHRAAGTRQLKESVGNKAYGNEEQEEVEENDTIGGEGMLWV